MQISQKKQGRSTVNRFCYRVFFNKSLGRLVVVSETTKALASRAATTLIGLET